MNITLKYYIFVQLYNKGGENERTARAHLIAIVRNAGEVGFSNLVAALVKNNQENLARKLDEELAETFIDKQPAAARMCSYQMLRT